MVVSFVCVACSHSAEIDQKLQEIMKQTGYLKIDGQVRFTIIFSHFGLLWFILTCPILLLWNLTQGIEVLFLFLLALFKSLKKLAGDHKVPEKENVYRLSFTMLPLVFSCYLFSTCFKLRTNTSWWGFFSNRQKNPSEPECITNHERTPPWLIALICLKLWLLSCWIFHLFIAHEYLRQKLW